MPADPFDHLDFFDRFEADQLAGRDLPLSHYLRQFPGIEDAVARDYLLLKGDGAVNEVGAPAEAAAPAGGGAAQRIGPFRLERELGRGGQGTVHLAIDLRVGRRVALKVLSREAVGSTAARARFRREAEAIARLDHPSLCAIYEASLDEAVPYIAMRFVDGETLRDQIQRARTAVVPALPGAGELPGLLRLFERTARALHAAHEAGIVHRDIKPGNLQVDRDGVPVILDFGLARFDEKQANEPVTLTAPGQAFGTPAYMAPEQFRRGGNTADHRADIYALGVSLYERLTLVLPPGAVATSGREASQTPPPDDPAELNSAIGDELRVVLATAMAAEPGHRYATALAFAEDLRRICEFEPILARPASAWLRLRRWARRRRRRLTAAALVGSMFLGGVYITTDNVIAARVRTAQRAVLASRDLAQTDPQLALETAVNAWGRGTEDVTNTAAIEALGHDHLQWETGASSATDTVRNADCLPLLACAGPYVGVATTRYAVQVLDVATGACLSNCRGEGEVCSVAATDAGAFLVVRSGGGIWQWTVIGGWTSYRCNAEALVGRHVLSFEPVPGPGRRFAIVTREGDIVLWDEATATQLLHVRHPEVEMHGGKWHLRIAVSADAAYLAAGFGRRRDSEGEAIPEGAGLVVWQVASPMTPWVVPDDDVRTRLDALAFAADGPQLLSACENGCIELFDCDQRRSAFPRVKLEAEPYTAQFHPDGRHLVVGLGGGRRRIDPELAAQPIRMLDRANGAEVVTAEAHKMRGVMAMQFSPDGKLLASAGTDRSLAVRDAATLREVQPEFGVTTNTPVELQWCAKGDSLLTICNGRLSCWNVWHAGIRALPHDSKVGAVCWEPGTHRLVTATSSGRVALWSGEDGSCLRQLGNCGVPIRGVRFSPDGRWLIVQTSEPRVRIFDAATWQQHVVEFEANVVLCAMDPRSRVLAVGLEAGTVELVDLAERHRSLLGRHAGVVCAAFAADGATLLTGGSGRVVVLWDVATHAEICRQDFPPEEPETYFKSYDLVQIVAPVGSGWVVSVQDKQALYWQPGLHLANGQPAERLPCELLCKTLAVDPRGTMLAFGTSNNGTQWVSWPDRRPTKAVEAGAVPVLQYSRSGRFLLDVVRSSTARLLRARPGEAPEVWARLSGHTGPIVAADISTDERFVATASVDHTVRIWPTEPIEFCRERRWRYPRIVEAPK